MELQHFSHTHPLIFNEGCTQIDDHKAYCSACGELSSGPSFNCVGCGFYLHKQCAEAPTEMDHPFHRNHSFKLLQKIPYKRGRWRCDFCYKTCEHFVYHCSCKLDLHIQCALLTYNIAKKRMGELQHVARIDPLISTESHGEELKEAECFACWKPLLDSEYLSPDSGFYLHAKCVDLPSEINHLLHQQHPLFLQFIDKLLPCGICQQTQEWGFIYCCLICEFVLHIGCASIPTKIHHFCHRKHPITLQLNHYELTCQICEEMKKEPVYCCSICEFAIHIECASTTPTIEHKNHPHPFHLFKRRASYICDACGTSGNYVSYTCLACSIIVHKKCISLPPAIKFYRHYHPLSHNYFLENDELERLECGICRKLVDTEYGSYFCSKCNYIVHVSCALERSKYYYEVGLTEIVGEEAVYIAPYSKVTGTCINHFSHHHNLEFSEDMKDDNQCNGCLLFISTSYYYCSQCDFFLHKSCAELSLMKHLWFHHHQKLARLTSGDIFTCSNCEYVTNGFAYNCDVCKKCFCLRCALLSDSPLCEAHEHPLPYNHELKAICDACGRSTSHPYRCKICHFNLHGKCLRRPLAIRHKCDVHLLKLTYGDTNNYSKYHYCDICEKKRNSNHWFYHCAICDNSVHVKCAIGKYSFIKLGSIYTNEDHLHPLTFVQKVHFYPECHECDEPCNDLALECNEIGCDYIAHWECLESS